MKLNEMGTTGLAAYVREAKTGRAKNARRIHAERVLAARYTTPTSRHQAIERFRNLISQVRP